MKKNEKVERESGRGGVSRGEHGKPVPEQQPSIAGSPISPAHSRRQSGVHHAHDADLPSPAKERTSNQIAQSGDDPALHVGLRRRARHGMALCTKRNG